MFFARFVSFKDSMYFDVMILGMIVASVLSAAISGFAYRFW